MYTADHAEVYDLVYEGRGKDYEAEAADVLALVEERAGAPAESLLDVACGTGTHLRHFAAGVGHADGLELSGEMLDLARRRAPSAGLHQGDMRGFDLGRTYTAVVCMFSSIGYMRDTAELGAALRAFADHLDPGGVAVVEPWWFPDTFLGDYVSAHVVGDDRRTVSRVSYSVLKGDATHMEVHFVVAEPGVGVRHFTDVHEITLFTREEYEAAFTGAGLSVEFLDGPSGRGLFVGVKGR
ncbi:class I SAM-dependent DNA methyltransferase [Nocardiopsis sp. NPDC058631]|uniref:class I SAM-dependent DNA methyltransferase n=1 Tax=Nocardiopsis sp. NPDC058631 TaxID=3346566 RepID=UPI00364BD6B5